MVFPNFIPTFPLAAADPEAELPTLEHGVPDAGSYLPGTPAWVWVAIGAGVVALLVLIVWLIRRFKKPVLPPLPPARDHFRDARTSLTSLANNLADRPINEIASEASLILRRYFASTCAEPALYQTNEEFAARQIDLPKEASDLLRDLNAAKYSKSITDRERAESFVNRSQTCLETINSARNISA